MGSTRWAVVVSGTFGGSMQVDDVMLVTGLPEASIHRPPVHGVVRVPPPLDNVDPVIGYTIDPRGEPLNTVPKNIFVEATSPNGRSVFFMPPTAIDVAHAGTNVALLAAAQHDVSDRDDDGHLHRVRSARQ